MSVFRKRKKEIDKKDAFMSILLLSVLSVIIGGMGLLIYKAFLSNNPNDYIPARWILGIFSTLFLAHKFIYYYPRIYNYLFCRPTKKEKLLYSEEELERKMNER